ncbi:MAG: hypothetical protein J6M02_01765 [Clostridia bacterium]|nr:hypothetical protein [Clostridia bacterium]
MICLLITLSLNNTLREIEQSRRLYRHEEIVEPTETHTICFKDGSLYQTNFYGNSDLIEESAEGFYRFHIIRYASGNPIAVPQVISIAETDELIIEPTCHKPLVKEYTLYKKLITPEGETCYESSESRYVLILPPNSIKRISSFEGS